MLKITDVKDILKSNSDVTLVDSKLDYVFIYQNDLFDIRLFNRDYLSIIKENNGKSLTDIFIGICKPIDEDKIDKILELLFTGMMIIYDKNRKEYLMLDLISKPSRSVTDSISEPDSITGSRDGFVESLKVNIALIRNRIKDANLQIDERIIGRRSKTRVNILSINNLTNRNYKNITINILDKIDVDGIYSMEDITTYFQKDSLMPKYLYYGSPDLVARHLTDGEIIIVIDGIPNVICLPTTITDFFKLRVEQINIKSYSYILRLFISFAFFLSTASLGFLFSFLTYQSDSLSLLLLSTLKETQKGVFLPVHMEIFLILFLFELYYIVSFKSPKLTLSSMVVLVGGIIIGQNTVQSGMVGVFVITIVALAFLSSFTISSNVTFVMSISLLRLSLLISSMVFGIFGLTLQAFYLVVRTSKESTYKIEYLFPLIPFNKKGIKKSILFEASPKLKTRPKYLNVKNKRKKK